MRAIKFSKSIVLIALLVNNLAYCMSEINEPRHFPIIPTSMRRWWSSLGLPSLSTSNSVDGESATILRSIEEKARARTEEEELIEGRNYALGQAESSLRKQRGSTLVKAIFERYFSREINVDELDKPADQWDHVVAQLTIAAPVWYRITPEQIASIGQRFPNIRELTFVKISLGDKGLQMLSAQPFAGKLIKLSMRSARITVEGVKASIGAFISLTSLDISWNDMGDKVLAAIARAPFAGNLTKLNIEGPLVTDEGVKASIGAFTSLTSLDISFNPIGDEGLAAIARAPCADNLTELNIEGVRVTTEGVQANIGVFISLTILNISANYIGDVGLAAIAQASFAGKLTRLNIGCTNITGEGVEASIGAFTRLTSLDVTVNDIDDEALAALARESFAGNLTELKIGATRITDKGVQASIGAFTRLTSLAIVISDNIGDEGLAAIAGAPCAGNLTELNMIMTRVTGEGVQASIGAFTRLTSLAIEHNNIGNKGLAAIAGAPCSGNLTELDIGATHITGEGVQASIGAFTRLTSLAIEHNNIGNKGLAAIAGAPCAGNLTELKIGETGITAEGVQASIRAFKNLRNLSIERNNIGDKGLAAIAGAPCAGNVTGLSVRETGITGEGVQASIGAFTRLTSLDISFNAIGDEGMAVIARQPYASYLTLYASNANITTEWLRKHRNEFDAFWAIFC